MQTQIKAIKEQKISQKRIFEFLELLDIIYDEFTEFKKKEFLHSFIKKIEIYPEPLENGQILKSIQFRFPVYYQGNEVDMFIPNSENTVDTEVSVDYTGKRVLLVEDNELNRELASAILGETGIEIDCAVDGIEAVNRINEAPEGTYDLVLMDIQVPRMDGYTATREIRTLSNNRKANIPIVAMTANAFEEDRRKAFECGMNGHIVKPIDMKGIAKVLDRIFK